MWAGKSGDKMESTDGHQKLLTADLGEEVKNEDYHVKLKQSWKAKDVM